ncbi:uncharacterized protein LOC141831928 isoform X2 [Curcuma longa]|uniref:uncharacterized protein LOC141831928 isoform X2 n=1 Tax=Curcuma longa TaxID=136217 RepID=UPI003D9F23D9
MKGKGTDLRSDAAENPSSAPSPPSGLDLFSQARKALSVRCPFDGEESTPRVPTLPSRLASFLARASESHKKQRKVAGENTEKPSTPGKPPTVWDETEEYFRPLTLSDVDLLVPTLELGPGSVDSCLIMPVLGNWAEGSKTVGESEPSAPQLNSVSLPEKEQQLLDLQTEETEKVQDGQKVPLPETDGIPAPGDGALLAEGEEENDHSLSFHWLLGSKERFNLTSQRPNKNRKLLGGDAGLDRLLLLPHSHSGAEICDACCTAESRAKSNKLLHCHSCKALVHQKCYGVNEALDGAWVCSWCKHLEKASKVIQGRPCFLCPREGGAMKELNIGPSGYPSDYGTFVHLFCSLWTPEVFVEDTASMQLVMNAGSIDDNRRRLVCHLCKVKHGVCVRCSHGTCRTSFHPMCARESKNQMEIWGKFGCSNVELRAFCSKHTAFQDVKSVKDFPTNFLMATDDHSMTDKLSINIPPAKKLPKLRFTRKNRDKNYMQNEIAKFTSEKIVQVEPGEQDTVGSKLNLDSGQAGSTTEMASVGAIDSEIVKRSTADVPAILRELIVMGKISAEDVASEMGISLGSLQAALVGETTSFSPGLKLKIIKWLQNSVHVSALPPSKLRNSPMASSEYKVTKIDSLNAVKGKDPENKSTGDKVTSAESSDAVLVKSLPPQRRTKGHMMIKNNDKALCSSLLPSILENSNGNIDSVPLALSKDMVQDASKRKSPNPIEGIPNDQNHPEMIIEDTLKNEDSSPLHPGYMPQGNPLRVDTNNLPYEECKIHDVQEKVADLHCSDKQAEDADAIFENKPQQEFSSSKELNNELEAAVSCKFYLENGALDSFSNVHPLINMKLLQMRNSFKKTPGDPTYNGNSCPQCIKQGLLCSSTGTHCSLDGTKIDQISKTKNMGLLELSPEDEVEGEIVYFQSKLLDNAMTIKHKYDDLLLRIVKNLPHELNESTKQKWDLILVNQFFHEIKEAKKRGRKEKKNKEAQAVYAAAAEAAAVSSRNSLRKDNNDEIIAAAQEIPANLNAATGRAGLPLVPRPKEAFRSAVLKLTSDKQTMAFQMPEFLKDNVLSCEICMRTETMLNRIFVCSTCKVAVHLDCYQRLSEIPVGPWKCERCEEMSLSSTSPQNVTDANDRNAMVQCGLCGTLDGAMRKSADGQWVHAFCAEWLLETCFRRGQEDPIQGLDTSSKGKDTCSICHLNVGSCLKCSYGNCKCHFHPFCASSAGFYMNAKVTGSNTQHKAYCGKHSVEQREADNRQCGAEDLKSLKQIRVELEKVRLLCERIIKREKLKKDLLLCSHDILASKRDSTAYSALATSSFLHPGASSESATTSINNRSHSGMVLRSDEVTVDSTFSNKRKIRFSLSNKDVDRHTDDSSTSQSSIKRKLAERDSLAGKQLPRRSASMAFRISVDDGNRKIKEKKEAIQDLALLSDQTSMQNQRPSKGYFYVPVGSFSKERALKKDMEPHEPREPGG